MASEAHSGGARKKAKVEASEKKARIAVLGCGWWSQGWHLPHLSRHPQAEIVAVVDPNPTPRSAINELVPVAELGKMYGCATFASLDELLASDVVHDVLLWLRQAVLVRASELHQLGLHETLGLVQVHVLFREIDVVVAAGELPDQLH